MSNLERLSSRLPAFEKWISWGHRPKLRDGDIQGVPRRFGLFGLYLLAHAEDGTSLEGAAGSDRHLLSNVVYIGMSTHIDQRLSAHSAVRRYRQRYDDRQCSRLWLSVWHSGTTSFADTSSRSIAHTELALLERLLLWQYAHTFKRLPALNRC